MAGFTPPPAPHPHPVLFLFPKHGNSKSALFFLNDHSIACIPHLWVDLLMCLGRRRRKPTHCPQTNAFCILTRNSCSCLLRLENGFNAFIKKEMANKIGCSTIALQFLWTVKCYLQSLMLKAISKLWCHLLSRASKVSLNDAIIHVLPNFLPPLRIPLINLCTFKRFLNSSFIAILLWESQRFSKMGNKLEIKCWSFRSMLTYCSVISSELKRWCFIFREYILSYYCRITILF